MKKPVHSRNKGQSGEREVFSILSDLLGTVVKRNINARKGDPDGLDIPGYSCEVKRTEQWLEAYWEQAKAQAEKYNRRPVLFWRKSRQQWTAYIDPADIGPFTPGLYRIACSLEFFAMIVRERL